MYVLNGSPLSGIGPAILVQMISLMYIGPSAVAGRVLYFKNGYACPSVFLSVWEFSFG